MTSAMAALATIASGEVSAEDLTRAFLARIEEANPKIGAVRALTADAAISAAEAVDRRRSLGQDTGPLGGLPVLVKENCDTEDAPCSANLAFRQGRIAEKDSWVTARLRAAGAVVLGVSVSDPGAFNVLTPEVRHPRDSRLTVGGSSGGSAAALAAGLCLGAIGTDTGGSIRIPSACCGTVGLKPTIGSLPMDGVFPLIPSLDHVGPMAKSVQDVHLMWSALSQTRATQTGRVQKVGVDPAWLREADDAIGTALEDVLARLTSNGIEVVEVSLPDLDEIAEMHGRVFFVEGAAFHGAHYAEHIEHYPDVAREWFELARAMRVDAYVEACAQRVRFTRQVDDILRDVDVLLSATIPTHRPLANQDGFTVNGRVLDATMALVRLTSLFDHTGHPALSVPIAPDAGGATPSVQFVGRRDQEQRLLQFAQNALPSRVS